MSSCPWCNTEDMTVRGNAWMNADVYQRTNLVVTRCCDKPVTITPLRTYRVSKYHGNATEDDWGNVIKKEKPKPDTKELERLTARLNEELSKLEGEAEVGVGPDGKLEVTT